MVIYLDVLIVINFYITYFSLKAAARVFHAGYRTRRLITASVIGGFSSVSALIPLDFFLYFLLRILLTAAIVLTALGFGGIRSFLLHCMAVLTCAVMVSGTAVMLRELTGSSFFGAAGGYAYLDISVMHLIISTTAVYIVLTLFRRIHDKPQKNELIKILIKHNGKTAEITAYPDSGNNLRDFLTGLPVIVCRKDKIRHIMPFTAENPKGIRLIPFSSVGGNGIITAFRAESITVCRENGKKINIDALIGAQDGALANENFDAVINPKILIQ